MARPFALFAAACLLAVITAVDSWGSFSYLKKLGNILIFFWVINALTHVNPMQFLSELTGCLKMKRRINTNMKIFGGIKVDDPVGFVVFLFFVSAALSATYGYYQAFNLEGTWDPNVVRGAMSHPFTFSALLMMITCLAIARLLFDNHSNKFSLCLIISFLLGSLALSLARLSWFGLFVSATFLFLVRKRILIVIPTFILVLVVAFGPQVLSNEIQSVVTKFDRHSMQQRYLLWEAGWQLFKDHPISGCGFNCTEVIDSQYPNHPILKKFNNLHNNIVQISVDSGIIGICAWLFLWVAYFRAIYVKWKNSKVNDDNRWIVIGSAAAVISFLCAGFADTNFYDSEVVMVVYFIMALPFVSRSLDCDNPERLPAETEPVDPSPAVR